MLFKELNTSDNQHIEKRFEGNMHMLTQLNVAAKNIWLCELQNTKNVAILLEDKALNVNCHIVTHTEENI